MENDVLVNIIHATFQFLLALPKTHELPRTVCCSTEEMEMPEERDRIQLGSFAIAIPLNPLGSGAKKTPRE